MDQERHATARTHADPTDTQMTAYALSRCIRFALSRSMHTLVLLLLTIALGGCQIFTWAPAPMVPLEKRTWADHLYHLGQLEDWRIRGKIGYQSKQESGSAYVDWVQSRDSFHITLTGPLGQGTTIISGNAQGAKLESNKEGIHYAESPEQLLMDHTGFALPVSDMYHWIKGMPSSSNNEKVALSPENTLQQLQQGDWQIDYTNFQPHLNNLLPTRIKIKGRALKITLVIKEWAPLPEE